MVIFGPLMWWPCLCFEMCNFKRYDYPEHANEALVITETGIRGYRLDVDDGGFQVTSFVFLCCVLVLYCVVRKG